MGKGAKKREAKKQMEESAQSASASGIVDGEFIKIAGNNIIITPRIPKGKATFHTKPTITHIANLLSLVIFDRKPLNNCFGQGQVIKTKNTILTGRKIKIIWPEATRESKEQIKLQLISMIDMARRNGINVTIEDLPEK